MTDAAFERFATMRKDLIAHNPRRAKVVNHRTARLFGQKLFRQKRRDLIARCQLATLVDKHRPIAIAIKRNSQIGADFFDLGLQVDHVARIERIGLVVGEAAVDFKNSGVT